LKLLGITGGIGMGKSAAADCLRRLGIPVADTDVIARQVVEPGQPALAEIAAEFGADVLAEDGTLNRAELARRVFGDDTARRKLEAILHPRIREAWQAEAEKWRARGEAAGAVVIPLLFETDTQSHFTATVCLACSTATQQQRLVRRGWTPEQIHQRTAAQLPVAEKLARADYVVWNEAGLDVLEAQLRKVLDA
jgi:dephospho-CoA kinase